MKQKKRNKRRRRLIFRLIIFLLIVVCVAVVVRAVINHNQQPDPPPKDQTIQQEPQKPPEVIIQDTADQNIYSRYVLLMDLESEKILLKRAYDSEAYPASLTKVMTTIVAIKHLDDLQKQIKLPKDIFGPLYDSSLSLAGFSPGEQVRAIDLLYGVMLPSGAEAAVGLALDIAGSEAAFVQMMNQKAKDLGLEHTHFTNVSGMHNNEHYTSAKDMATILTYALKNQTFYELFTSTKHLTQPTNMHKDGITLHSTLFENLPKPTVAVEQEIMGGKTGYTSQAGLCLASIAKAGGKTYLLVTMGAPGSYKTPLYHITDALYIYGEYLK